MSKRLPDWRILFALAFCASLALAPAIAEARAGHSWGGRASSFGNRGLRSFAPSRGQPLERSMTPAPSRLRQPGLGRAAPAYGGGFFRRHPFLTGLAGGLLGAWLFGHSGFSGAGLLIQLLLIGLLIYLAVRLFRGRALSSGSLYSGPLVLPGAGGPAPPAGGRGRDIALSEADLDAFQALHAAVQEAWSAADLARMRPLMTPEMLGYFSEELAGNTSRGVQNIVADVALLKGELVEAWDEGERQYATAYLRWRARDYLVRLGAASDAAAVGGDPREPVEAEEVWTFVRASGGSWLLSAIQQV